MYKTGIRSVVLVLMVASMALACTSQNPEPRSQFSDAVIASQVRTALEADGSFSATSVRVLVDRGVVTLQGSLPTSVAIDRAVSIAGGVEGVVQVRNELALGR